MRKMIKNYRFNSVFFMAGIMLSAVCSQAYAAELFNEAKPGFQIRQEKVRKNGVAVSRPVKEDKIMVDFITSNKFKTLADYSKWLKKNVKYRKDRTVVDDWTPPLETLKKKAGDCEDYAFLTAALMRVLGYQPHFIAFERKGFRHAVCVFKKKGYYYWFDNAEIKQTKAKTILEFAKHITKNYKYYKLDELNLETKEWKTVYRDIRKS